MNSYIPNLGQLSAIRKHTQAILYAVADETKAQIIKWGVQSHPNGTGGRGAVRIAEQAKRITDLRAGEGSLTWRDILNEEVWEAFAETDDQKLEDELVQVAAVCASWVRDIQTKREGAGRGL